MGWFFKSPLWARVMVGLVLGAIAGMGLRYGVGVEPGAAFAETWVKPFGDAFIRLIRMLIVPLVFFTLTAGVVAMGDPKRLGSLGTRTLAMYMGTTVFAVTLGLLFATLFNPGIGVDVSGADPELQQQFLQRRADPDAPGGILKLLLDQILNIIPGNFVAAATGDNILGVIFFSIMFGVGILVLQEKARAMADGINSGADVMIRITEIVMQAAPFGVFALITHVIATRGLTVLDNLLMVAAALYVACLVQMIFTYGLVIIKLVLGLPIIRFFRGMTDAIAVAYSTSSSSATLPVTIANAVDNLGIKRTVASSVLPLGSTVNMDGTALYQGVIAVFAAQVFGIDLNIGDYVLVAVAATLVSIGTAGIPSVSLFLAFITLSVIGVTPEQTALIVAFIFPFDRLLDMMRTATNITGDAAVATAVAKWEGELDEEVFRLPARI